MASAGKLELALKAHEVVVSSLKKEPRADKLNSSSTRSTRSRTPSRKTATEAGRVKGNPEMDFTVQSLQKIDYKKEWAALESVVGPEPGDDQVGDADVSILKNQVTFGKVLRKGLARVGERPVRWGFVAARGRGRRLLVLIRHEHGSASLVGGTHLV